MYVFRRNAWRTTREVDCFPLLLTWFIGPCIRRLGQQQWKIKCGREQLIAERNRFLLQLSENETQNRRLGRWTTLESLWATVDHPISAADFSVIGRNKGQGALYSNCYEHVDKKMSKGSRSGSTNQIANNERIDAFGNVSTQAAHLLSHAQVCHKAFGFLGEAAVGMYFEDEKCNVFSLATNPPKTKRRKVLMGVSGVHRSSLKGNKFNKLYLKDHGEYFDTETPSILVIPILPLEIVKNWASSAESATAYDMLAVAFGPRSTFVHQDVLQYAPQKCTPDDIRTARELLEAFVKGIAGSIKENDALENLTEKELSSPQNISLVTWQALVKRIRGGTQADMQVPSQWAGPRDEPIVVAKARLTTGNSLPDPWLLALKSAINYSAHCGTRLLPACPSDVEGSDDSPPNTTQGMDFDERQDDLDAAALLAASLACGGKTVELFSDDVT